MRRNAMTMARRVPRSKARAFDAVIRTIIDARRVRGELPHALKGERLARRLEELDAMTMRGLERVLEYDGWLVS
jgi:hypothetical protein